MENITFERIKNDEIIREYIRRADRNLAAMGYTKHSFGHVTKVAEGAAEILTALGYDERTVELARIAGFLHDIGNVVNRADHAQSGAIMAFQLLTGMGMPAKEIGYVVSAIGHHDEGTAFPVNAIAAAVDGIPASRIIRKPTFGSVALPDMLRALPEPPTEIEFVGVCTGI